MKSDLLAVPHVLMYARVQVMSFSRRIMGCKSYGKELILGFECRQVYINTRTVISRDRDASQTSRLVVEDIQTRPYVMEFSSSIIY